MLAFGALNRQSDFALAFLYCVSRHKKAVLSGAVHAKMALCPSPLILFAAVCGARTAMSKHVVIVDGDPAHIASFSRHLIQLCPDWDLAFFANSAEALKHLAGNECDVFVSDMSMPDSTGPALLNEVGKKLPAGHAIHHG
jgi:PleD family two-component response regulator